MDQATINYQNMEDNINNLYNISSDIESILDNIKSLCNNHINEDSWNSPASNSFKQQVDLFTSNFAMLEENIARSVIYLVNSLDDYYQTDRELKQQIADKFYFNK